LIPATVKVVLANGSIDTSFSSSVSLSGATGTETFQFQDEFETNLTYTSIGSGGSTLSYDSTVYAAASTRSAKITGGNKNDMYGPFYDFGVNIKPVRYSAYMRSSNNTKLGPILAVVELYSGDYYIANNVLFDGSVGRIRMSRCTGTFGCTLVYSSGVAYNPNQWYKIDVDLYWNNLTADLWVDDIKRDTGFPMMYSDTASVRGVSYYNYDSGVTGWFDNVRVVKTEGNTTAISISPTSVTLTNGFWNGYIQAQTSGSTNMYVRATYSASGYKEGRSTTFNTGPTCVPGQYSVSYNTPCVSCGPGSYSTSNGAPNCTQCKPGTYQSQSSQTFCTNCTANTYNQNSSSISSGDCLPCSYPQTSDPGSAACSSCKPGEYYDNANSMCKGCGVGTYGIGGPSCLPCPPGTYNNMTNQSSCAQCPTGYTFSGQNATSILNCTACGVGNYALNASVCSICPQGSYNNISASASCTLCPAGTYNNNTGSPSFSDCRACPLGSYASQNGSVGCQACGIGTHANVTGLATCYQCAPGHATNTSGSINCTACVEGFHAQSWGSDICQPCDPGTASNSPAEDVCPPCSLGYASGTSGLTECSKCLIGTYANNTGTAVCTSCAADYTTLTDGATSDSDCVPKCGDGRLDTGEYCDDGNHNSHDGCSSSCVIEPGYVCLVTGQHCEEQDTGGNGGKSSAMVAAAVVGAIVILICVAGIIVGLFLYRRKTQQKQPVSVDMPVKKAEEHESYRRIPSIGMVHSSVVRSTLEASAESIGQRERMSERNTIPYTELDTSGSSVVGKGAFGVVFSAYWRGQKVAVKEIKNEHISADDLKKFIEEAELMRNLKPHANVVLFLGVVMNPFCIVTEFLEGGDLHTFLKSNYDISIELQLSIIKDIARGMFHLSLEGIVHRDLAARNVLLTKDLSAKVSDFGLSRIADADNVIYSKSDIGPLKWMAPEAIRRKKYSEKSDVWAFGVTCWEIISREEPFKDMDAVQVATAVVGEGLRPEIPPNTHPQLADIIMATWETEPEMRPTFHQLINLLETVDLRNQ